MQEEILIKASRTGTTIYFFNTDINENNYSVSTVPAVMRISSTEKVPLELNTFDGVTLTGDPSTILWKRNTQSNWYNSEIKMNYVFGSFFPDSDYISGRTFSQVSDSQLTQASIDTITSNFVEAMDAQFTAGTTSYVFFEDTELDDLYASVKLERTFDILDTLNIYNKVSGEYTIRESTTGVVFGKLEAIQKISDENGNRLRIPLRNVPVGIFVSSPDFETPNDVDKDGNRLKLNYRPLTSTEESYPSDCATYYFNSESASFDNEFLTQVPLDGLNLHPTFTNVVYTNENGEFILHNIEVGPQILFFEVDLLKQGLTKDEVALNFFPYPPNFENASIDTIPHYFYRAIPIDVVPSWGESYQTGYTEVDISINLDLRKWATYIFPPITYQGYAIDDAAYRKISRAPLTVQVRDMSKYNKKKLSALTVEEQLEVYPSKGIQMVEIQDIVDKNSGQQWEWANEFSQIKDKALFHTYAFHAIKLPANIYDNNGYKTDKFAEPQSGNTFLKGTWLCGYQLKIFLTKERSFYRTTGLALENQGGVKWYDRDHFHCSLYDKISDLSINEPAISSYNAKGTGLGIFPYEKAWTKDYPKSYSIPKPPKIENFVDYYNDPNREYIETPRFADGDLVPGSSWLNNGYYGWNGWGLSWYSVEQYTDFATDVIGGVQNSDMYRYEPIGAGTLGGQNQYFGCYTNGYCNNLDNGTGVGATSTVPNAEEFQRIEAGYGYYLFPSSMPRIVPIPSGLIGFSPKQVDINAHPNVGQNGLSTIAEQTELPWWHLKAKVPQYNSYSVLNNSKSISMDLGGKLTTNFLINDKLNIYRIIEGSGRVPYDIPQPIIPTYTKFVIEEMYFTSDDSGNSSGSPVKLLNFWIPDQFPSFGDSHVTLTVENTGVEVMKFQARDYSHSNLISSSLDVGESIQFEYGVINTAGAIRTNFASFEFIAQGNHTWDQNTNKYLKTSLKFTTSASWHGFSSGQKVVNLTINDKCNTNCLFDASDYQYGNTFYANTIWKAANIKYYERDGNNGYPISNDIEHYDGDCPSINGMYFNPGDRLEMRQNPDGSTFSWGTVGATNRLNSGGAMEFYWSKTPRLNPNNGYAYTPLATVAAATNWDPFWSTRACQMASCGY